MKVEYGESFLRVADPVVDGFIKASNTSVTLPCAPVDGDVLISLEVNGTVVARRELFTMVEGSVDVGDYTVAYSGGAVTIATTKSNDVVEIRIEPVEVVISDAFRAAVNETAPQTPNELPAITESDDGKVLIAQSNGTAKWVEKPYTLIFKRTSSTSATKESGPDYNTAYTQSRNTNVYLRISDRWIEPTTVDKSSSSIVYTFAEVYFNGPKEVLRTYSVRYYSSGTISYSEQRSSDSYVNAFACQYYVDGEELVATYNQIKYAMDSMCPVIAIEYNDNDEPLGQLSLARLRVNNNRYYADFVTVSYDSIPTVMVLSFSQSDPDENMVLV